MGFAFIPIYIKYMGIESYGLIGIFIAFQAILGLLDMGISTTVTRELARLSILPGQEREMRNLVRSLEIIYWGVAIFIGILIMALSPLLALHWIKAGQLSPSTIQRAVLIMGFATALQWPASFYSGGLIGLQRQVLLNGIAIGISTMRGIGAVLILWLVSPTIQAFFSWQIFINATNTFLLAKFLWKELPHKEGRAVFRRQAIQGVWRFAAGISVITIMAMILTQLDKIILSRMLSLEMFGYYTLAGVVASSLYRVIYPVSTAIYPRFAQLVSLGDQDGLKQLYHKSCQLMSTLILPVAAVIAIFSYDILFIWQRNPATAQKAHLLVSLLICGSALNGLMNVPYMLQLADAWTRLALYANLIAIIIMVPMIIYMTTQYGAVGGASVWLILNIFYVPISLHFMHKRLLPHEKWRWYWQDVGLPLVTCVILVVLGRMLVHGFVPNFVLLTLILLILVISLGITALVTPTTRIWLLEKIARAKSAYI